MKMKTLSLILSASALALTGCATQFDNPGPSIARHKIQVAESIERLELYPNASGMALSARDRQAMLNFLSNYRRDGEGPIFMNSPRRSGPAISSASREVRSALAYLGMDGIPLQEGNYPTEVGAPAPLVVSYRRLKTLVPDCRQGDNLADTSFNSPSPNWGCAYHANIAAMVADPRQFLNPYALGEPNMQRRMRIYESYIEGESTAAEINPDQRVSSQNTGGGGGGG